MEPPRRRLLGLCLLALGCGLFVLFYRGPGRVPLRAHGGDVAIVAFLFFLLGLLTRWSPRLRAALVGALAAGVELLQLLRPPTSRSLVVELTVGTTFDPYDLLAYALGLALAVVAERSLVAPRP